MDYTPELKPRSEHPGYYLPVEDATTQTTQDFILLEPTREASTQTMDDDIVLFVPTRDASTQTTDKDFDLLTEFQSTKSFSGGISERETAALDNDNFGVNEAPRTEDIDYFYSLESDPKNATAESGILHKVPGNVAFYSGASVPDINENGSILNTHDVHLSTVQHLPVYVSLQSSEDCGSSQGTNMHQLLAVPLQTTDSYLPQIEVIGSNVYKAPVRKAKLQTILPNPKGSLSSNCKKSFRNESEFKLDVPSTCDAKYFSCDKCAKTFHTKVSLKFHKKVHKPRILKCTQCDYASYCRYLVKLHTKRIHNRASYTSVHKLRVKHHLKRIHYI